MDGLCCSFTSTVTRFKQNAFVYKAYGGYTNSESMSLHSISGNASVLRIISHVQRLKLAPASNKNLLCNCKVLQGFCEHTSRITYAHSTTQSCSYEIQEVEKEQPSLYLQENFLKENFNIIDSRYFKLVTLPSECNNLETLLWTDEFKKILSRSSFTYDVDVIEDSKHLNSEVFNYDVYRKNICTKANISETKPSINAFDTVFMNKSETTENKGKASEEQLLYIINRLTYSLINFFEKPHDYSIYHKNIVFQNNIRGVTIKGLNAYAQNMYLMRLYGILHFAKVKVEILKITHHVEDGTIRVRWRVNGIPRHKFLIMLFKHKIVDWRALPNEASDWLDGFSIFSVGDDGLIFKHICDKMIPDDVEILTKNVDLKSKVLGLFGLAPRGSAALNTLLPCCRSQDILSCKKVS